MAVRPRVFIPPGLDVAPQLQACVGWAKAQFSVLKIENRNDMKWLFLLPLALATALYGADNKPKAETFLEAAAAGPDYADQGEYKNDWGGAQIIALGEGNFRMVTYRGGLPGAGWDKDFKQEIPGKRDGARILFAGEKNYRAELSAAKITITTETGGPYTM